MILFESLWFLWNRRVRNERLNIEKRPICNTHNIFKSDRSVVHSFGMSNIELGFNSLLGFSKESTGSHLQGFMHGSRLSYSCKSLLTHYLIWITEFWIGFWVSVWLLLKTYRLHNRCSFELFFLLNIDYVHMYTLQYIYSI